MDPHSKNIFWLLDVAVELGIPLDLITDSASRIAGRFNVRPHNMTTSQVVTTVAELCAGGLISVRIGDEEAQSSDTSAIVHEIIQSELRDVSYQLTTAGGALWESIAKPDWQRYVCYEFLDDDGDSEFVLITCSSIRRVEEAIQAVARCQRFSKCTAGEYEILVPWSATYWKLLEFGYQGCFQIVQHAIDCSEYRAPTSHEIEAWSAALKWCQRGFKGGRVFRGS